MSGCLLRTPSHEKGDSSVLLFGSFTWRVGSRSPCPCVCVSLICLCVCVSLICLSVHVSTCLSCLCGCALGISVAHASVSPPPRGTHTCTSPPRDTQWTLMLPHLLPVMGKTGWENEETFCF